MELTTAGLIVRIIIWAILGASALYIIVDSFKKITNEKTTKD